MHRWGWRGGDRETLERITAYTLHPPLSLNRLNYVSGSSTVLYTGRFNPGTKSNFTVLDCRDFLCNLILHVPHAWEALIRYYGAAASTTRRGEETQQEPLIEEGEGEYKSKSKRSWARLIKKHFVLIVKVDADLFLGDHLRLGFKPVDKNQLVVSDPKTVHIRDSLFIIESKRDYVHVSLPGMSQRDEEFRGFIDAAIDIDSE